jgi:hypothetical protein
MACDSAPTEPPFSASELSSGHGERADPDERFGPVTLARHAKDDGRALILYTHRRAPDATAEDSQT